MGIAGVKDGGKVGRSVAVVVGEAVSVDDGLGVNVGRGDGVSDEVEVKVGLIVWEIVGAIVGEGGVEIVSD